jgi:enolase
MGCRRAAANVGGSISDAARGRDLDQAGLDQLLIALDGTDDKARLGGNSLLAASLAFARASALEAGGPLFQYFAGLLGESPSRLPRPTIQLFGGGLHAGGQVPVQDVLVVSISASTVDDALVMTSDIYRSAQEIVRCKHGERPLVADEGGLAPSFAAVSEMFDDAVEAITKAGLRPGVDVALAVDVAANQFREGDAYRWETGLVDAQALIDVELDWLEHYPIVSIEDGLSEDDWQGWVDLKHRVKGRALVIGDDLLATRTDRIRRALQRDAADTLLLKPNQVGTITESLDACRLARAGGWTVTLSARSGDTADDSLAALAVGWSADQINVGSLTRSERLSKWNRLLAIERETGLPVHLWPAPRAR